MLNFLLGLGGIIVLCGGIIAAFLGVQRTGVDKQKAKDLEVRTKNQEEFDAQLDKARDAGDSVRDSIDHTTSVRQPISGDEFDRAGRGTKR